MSRLFFVAMAGPGSAADLKELIDPIKDTFDGFVIVLHDACGGPEDQYLESIKKAGAVIHLPFARRHSFSRNHYLWCGPIEDGDWIVQTDTLERLNPEFAGRLRHMVGGFEAQGINAAFYYNKAFLYQQHESLEFAGSPHEGLRRHDGQMRAIELSSYYPTETDVRYSVRHLKRTDQFHWVDHYARYYIDYPYGSNHCLLGNCDRGDEMAIFRQREVMRNQFRTELLRRGVPRRMDAVIRYWHDHPLDDTMRRFVNQEKILNDLYRYHILNDLTCIDEHHWTSLKSV